MVVDVPTRRIKAAGFDVIDAQYQLEGLPSEMAAWKPVISSLARPDHVVPYSEDDALTKVEGHWQRLARQNHVVGPDNTLLVSLTRRRADSGGWVRVALPAGRVDLDKLGPNPGEPEFVAMSMDGSAVCGVTAEEYELWIVCARLV